MSRKQPEVPVKERRNVQPKHKRDLQSALTPQTPKQKNYIEALTEDNVVICLGPAGTGKTYCAATFAAIQLHLGKIDKIIITRPNVPTGRSIGFFPGTIEEKMAPWVAPITSVLQSTLGAGEYECHIKHKNVEIVPLEVIRGRSFDNSIVLIDEASNLTMPEIKVLCTRIGKNSTIVFMGDISQSDIDSSLNNELNIFCNLVEKHGIRNTSIIEFSIDDVVRSDICADFVIAFYKEGL